MSDERYEPDSPAPADPVAAARAEIQRDQKDRVTRCKAALDAVLKEHGCQLDVSVLLRQGQVIPQVGIVPLPDA